MGKEKMKQTRKSYARYITMNLINFNLYCKHTCNMKSLCMLVPSNTIDRMPLER